MNTDKRWGDEYFKPLHTVWKNPLNLVPEKYQACTYMHICMVSYLVNFRCSLKFDTDTSTEFTKEGLHEELHDTVYSSITNRL